MSFVLISSAAIGVAIMVIILWYVWAPLIIPYMIFAYFFMKKILNARLGIGNILQRINEVHKTHFDKNNDSLRLGEPGIGVVIYFDPANRKMLLTDGQTERIEDFSFITGHEATMGNKGYRYIKLKTRDFKTPIVTVGLFTNEEVENWDARLVAMYR